MKNQKILKLEVNNFIGITEATIEPKKMTVIKGRNGQGKTSIIEALKAAVKGCGADKIKVGHDSSTLFLSTDEIELRRRVTAKGTTVTVKKDGMTVNKPQAYLDGLIGDFSFEPIKFFTMTPKEQTAHLLKAIPVKATLEQLKTWTRGLHSGIINLVDLHGLEAIATAAEALYNLRAGDNSRVKDLEANITELKNKIPAGAADFNPAEMQAVMEQIGAAKAKQQDIERAVKEYAECGYITKELEDEHAGCVSRISARRSEVDAVEKLSKATVQDNTSLYEERNRLEAALKEVDEKIEAMHNSNREILSAQEKSSLLYRQISELKEDEINIVNRIESNEAKKSDIKAKISQAEETKSPIPALEARLEELKIAQSYQRDFDRLDEMKKELATVSKSADERDKAVKLLQTTAPAELLLAAKMPVEGLAYNAAGFTLNGVPIQNLSTSEKARLAVSVTRQLNKDYPIKAICLDGFESLDSAAQKAFMDAAEGDDFQYFVTQVADTNIEVTTK